MRWEQLCQCLITAPWALFRPRHPRGAYRTKTASTWAAPGQYPLPLNGPVFELPPPPPFGDLSIYYTSSIKILFTHKMCGPHCDTLKMTGTKMRQHQHRHHRTPRKMRRWRSIKTISMSWHSFDYVDFQNVSSSSMLLLLLLFLLISRSFFVGCASAICVRHGCGLRDTLCCHLLAKNVRSHSMLIFPSTRNRLVWVVLSRLCFRCHIMVFLSTPCIMNSSNVYQTHICRMLCGDVLCVCVCASVRVHVTLLTR